MQTAHSFTQHGVFICIFNEGVLITGKSGIGKSELGLQLIARGHPLIADDIVEFTAKEDGRLIGSCPQLLQNFLAIKGLSVFNIKALYGEHAIKQAQPLSLVIELVQFYDEPHSIALKNEYFAFGNLKVPQKKLATTHANLSLLVEVLVKNFKLQKTAYDASQAFIERQTQQLKVNRL